MTTTVPELAIGLDLGDANSQVCVLNGHGKITSRLKVATTPESFEALFHSFAGKPVRLTIEVGAHSRWVQKLARRCGIEDLVVANPRKIALISKSLKKTDQEDAYVLARAGQGLPEMLSPVEHSSDELYSDRALVQSRALLVRTQSQLVTRIRSLVKTTGSRLPPCSADAFFRKAPEHVPPILRAACAPLFEVLEKIHQQIAAIDKSIRQFVRKKYPIAARLQEIPGVGPIVALSFVLTVQDPRRFRTTRDIGAYLGLAPRKQQSGSSNPQLGITKAGDSEMRRLLVLAAHCLLARGKDCALKRWGKALSDRGGRSAKKRAIVALARKLAVTMLAIWKSNTPFDPWRGVPESERPTSPPLQLSATSAREMRESATPAPEA
jgi:transposase